MIKLKKWRVQYVLIVISLIIFSGCSLLPNQDEPLAPPLMKPVKQNFTIVEAKKGTIINAVKGIATFDPVNVAYHQFKSNGGRVKEVFVRSGDQVKKGDLLIQLEVEGLDLEIKQKQLALEKAKLGLSEAKLNQNEGLIKIKQLELEIAQMEYSRTLEKMNARRLIAEMDGYVSFVDDVEPPDMIQPYQVLVTVIDTNKYRLVYDRGAISTQLSNVKPGMTAEVSWKDKKFNAIVTQSPSSAPYTEDAKLREKYSWLLYLDLVESPENIEIGDYADITIITEKKDDVIILPTRAIRTFMTRSFVLILDGERLYEADIEIGIKTVAEVEIVNGLSEGQQIILP